MHSPARRPCFQPLAEVLLLTGHASVETSIEGMKLGAFDYLMKPIKLEEVLVKLAQAFEKKDTHDQKIRKAMIKELIRFPGRVLEYEKEACIFIPFPLPIDSHRVGVDKLKQLFGNFSAKNIMLEIEVFHCPLFQLF